MNLLLQVFDSVIRDDAQVVVALEEFGERHGLARGERVVEGDRDVLRVRRAFVECVHIEDDAD